MHFKWDFQFEHNKIFLYWFQNLYSALQKQKNSIIEKSSKNAAFFEITQNLRYLEL